MSKPQTEPCVFFHLPAIKVIEQPATVQQGCPLTVASLKLPASHFKHIITLNFSVWIPGDCDAPKIHVGVFKFKGLLAANTIINIYSEQSEELLAVKRTHRGVGYGAHFWSLLKRRIALLPNTQHPHCPPPQTNV